jgi:hypothetical protein
MKVGKAFSTRSEAPADADTAITKRDGYLNEEKHDGKCSPPKNKP